MENEYLFDKEYAEAMEEIAKHERAVCDHNNSLVRSLGKSAHKDFKNLIDCCDVTGKIEFVDKPNGSNQSDDDSGIFTNTHVDQWSVGIEGDSYEGFIYTQIPDKRWLKIPYSC